MNSYLLLIIGLISIFLEFYLPGAILGIIGVLLVITSVLTFAMNSDSALFTLLFILVTIVSLIFVIKFALYNIQRSRKTQSLMSDDDQDGFIASSYDSSLIGKKGVVATVLKPGGHVLIDGKRHLAISLSGYMEKGEEVEVIGGEGESLKVKKINKESESPSDTQD